LSKNIIGGIKGCCFFPAVEGLASALPPKREGVYIFGPGGVSGIMMI